MKCVTAREARNHLGAVLQAAQRPPVSVTRYGRPVVVVMSAESYARRRRMARERLRCAMARAGERACAQGLTDDALVPLLAEDGVAQWIAESRFAERYFPGCQRRPRGIVAPPIDLDDPRLSRPGQRRSASLRPPALPRTFHFTVSSVETPGTRCPARP